ncbi:DUF3923 family protein [Lentibacillus sp. CBA3610]|uniref:DUF3923 family protein n=1 Tax=Lentibacillus sp. CBA3610 TaxID=2518176 RepID=UPI001594FEAC|nr:DUF3923 family protein [Lentibacillus sp. CBA3610]QKY71272.1 DUF3923 family protein [Lentibacillus sp. CBA3610]
MKISWIFWWISNVFWMILFVVGTVFVWSREVDGSGAVQTPETKLLSFLVLLLAFLIPAIIQAIWLVINLVINNNKKSSIQQ